MLLRKNAVGKISPKFKIFCAVGKPLSLREMAEAQPLSMLVTESSRSGYVGRAESFGQT